MIKAHSSSSKNLHIRKVQAAPKPLTDQAYDGALLLFNIVRVLWDISSKRLKKGATMTCSTTMSIAYCRTLFFNLYSKYVASFYNGKQRRAKDIVGTAEGQEGKDK
jgi:hypothetical protein